LADIIPDDEPTMLSQSLISEPWAICRRDPARALNVAAVALFGFSIPIAPHWVAITTAIVVLVWLVRGRFRRLPGQVRHNPVVRSAVLLFGLLVVGIAYSSAELPEALFTLKKYRELLLIPLLMSLADSEEERGIAILGFMAAMLLSLALAYGEWFGLYNIGRRHEPTAFQHRIIFSTFLCFFLFWAAHRGFDGTRPWQWFWAAVVVAGTIFMFYAIGSRTGYVIFCLLAVLVAFRRLTLKGVAMVLVGLAALLVLVYYTSDTFFYRFNMAADSVANYEEGQRGSSTQNRIEQWRNMANAIGQSPIIGHGTGTLARTLKPIDGWPRFRIRQPHNEYLLITVQIGIVGLAALLWLFFSQWRAARRAPPPRSYLGEGLVVTIAVACLFNSAFLNSAEGHFYAFMSAMLFAGPASPPGESGST
jgi:O-antigen ligase